MTKKNDGLAAWGRFALEIGIIVVSIALAYGGLDKRLALIELQMRAASEAQKDWASKTALEALEHRIEKLEQGGSRGR